MKIDRSGVKAKAFFALKCEDADTSYTDMEFDEATRRWIADELHRGNQWAWCDVKVTGHVFGLEAETWLGQCSYESRENFMKCDYYASMVDEVVDALVKTLQAIADDHAIWDHDRVICIPCATTSAS